jgi:D-alanine--poly(phosphoribitol) ligase, subunit 1
MSLIDTIDEHGQKNGQRIAHSYRGSTLTYRELAEKSDVLAAYLIEEFKDDRTPIIVYGHKQHEMIICFLACVKSGHAYIPIDSSLPDERVKDIFESSGAKFAFSVGELRIRPENVTIKDKEDVLGIIQKSAGKKPGTGYRVKPEDPYYIIYTSGSTGKPKGVQVTLSCLESFVRWSLKICMLDYSRNYIFMNQAPFSFDLSVMDLYTSLYAGSTLFSIDKDMIANLKELFGFFKTSCINVWVSTPSFAEMCLADKGFNEELLPNLELMLFCGETLPNNCVEKLHGRFRRVRVINTYGPTEATVAVTSIEVNEEVNRNFNPLPVGYVKDECKLFIVDRDGKQVSEGEKGEIIICGDSVSPGYYRNEEMTRKAFYKTLLSGEEKRCYRTGDEGFIKDNLLYYCGRIDFQVKLNGFRIELEDIENNLKKVAFIDNAIVLPVSKNDKIQYLSAAITLNKVIDETEFKIGIMVKNELKRFLPDYMIPRKIMIKKSLPMTVNGKINRKILMEEI